MSESDPFQSNQRCSKFCTLTKKKLIRYGLKYQIAKLCQLLNFCNCNCSMEHLILQCCRWTYEHIFYYVLLFLHRSPSLLCRCICENDRVYDTLCARFQSALTAPMRSVKVLSLKKNIMTQKITSQRVCFTPTTFIRFQ